MMQPNSPQPATAAANWSAFFTQLYSLLDELDAARAAGTPSQPTQPTKRKTPTASRGA